MMPKLGLPQNISRDEAERLQASLSSRVVVEDRFNRVDIIAGVDVAYARQGDRAVAAVALLRASDLSVIQVRTLESTAHFSYIPTLFAFRELPVLCELLQDTDVIPDLLICDGPGIAHPRRFGLACHLGIVFDVPTIGCAKTRLCGSSVEPGIEKGRSEPLLVESEIVGCVLRTRTNTKPVYVSPGHRISVPSACEWALKLAPRFRLPEPLRLADQAARSALAHLSY